MFVWFLVYIFHFLKKIKKPKKRKEKEKKKTSVQLRAWALKLPSMKSPELGAWAPNDSQFPQGPKPKTPSIHPIFNWHDLQPLLVFKMCILKKKKKSCGLFFKRRCSFKIKNRSSSRVSKIQNFQNTFSNCA